MEQIGKSEIWSYLDDKKQIRKAGNDLIRKATGHYVASYLELAKKVAELQFNNPDYVLLFRGQNADFLNLNNESTLRPSIFRLTTKNGTHSDIFEKRFQVLANAEQILVDNYSNRTKFQGIKKLKRYRVLRWSILQHYEICYTPLLDVTHSLRIAASFASEDNNSKEVFFYVVGVPNISGSVTASAESGIQIIRLSSVCPPSAVRPHIQEGYLLGEYPEMTAFEQKRRYEPHEIDFGRRLIAKFRFNPAIFWDEDNFPQIKHNALYPDEHDPLFEMAQKIKTELGPQE